MMMMMVGKKILQEKIGRKEGWGGVMACGTKQTEMKDLFKTIIHPKYKHKLVAFMRKNRKRKAKKRRKEKKRKGKGKKI